MKSGSSDDKALIRGEFFTDGKKFIFRAAGTPITGIGDTPTAAFEDLMRSEAETAPLSARMQAIARDQEGETVRAAIIRLAAIALILLAVVGGALATSAALAPSVMTDIGALATSKIIASVEQLTPQREAALRKAMQRLDGIMDVSGGETGCRATQVPPTAP